jgi:polar amino acid transport system substrate-binding protein
MANKKIGFVAAVAAGLLLLAGCSSSSVNNGVDQSKVDKTAQALLPSKYLTNGINVASDIPWEPFEYNDASGKLIGFDVELGDLIGQKLGTKVTFNKQAFDSIIPSLEAGTHDIIISDMNDTLERQQKVDFVDYLIAGSQLIVNKGNPEGIMSSADLCGKTAIAEKGTTQIDVYASMSATCKTNGKQPITVISLPDAPNAYNALRANKGVAVMLDAQVAGSVATTAGGGSYFEVVNDPAAPHGYEPALVGIATLKADSKLRDAIQAAVKSLIADGQYATLLGKYKKYNMPTSGVADATINGTKN